MAIIGAAAAIAATAASTYATRDAARKAHQSQMDQASRARQDEENAKTQKEVTLANRAARAQQQALAGGGYQSTIGTSPLGLSGTGGAAPKDQFGV